MNTAPTLAADWITRGMQKLSADGKIARKPTTDEWERIRSSATAWSEQNGGVAGDVEQFILSIAPDVITGGSRPAIPFRMALPTSTQPSQPVKKVVIPREPKQMLAEIRSQTCYSSVRSLVNFVLVLEVIFMAITVVGGFVQLTQGNASVTNVCMMLAGWALILLASFAGADVVRAVVDTADIAVQNRAREG